MKRTLPFVFMFFLATSGLVVNAQEEVYLLSDIGEQSISNGLYFHAEDSEKPIKAILDLPAAGWTPLDTGYQLKFGLTKKVYWISWKIQGISKSSVKWALQVNNKGINEIELFCALGRKTISLGRTGDNYPFSSRPYPSNYSVFLLPEKSSDSARYILYVDKINENLQLSLNLIPLKSLQKKESISLLFMGFFTGILLLGCFLSLYVFSVFKDKMNFWYAIYILSVINLLFAYERIDFQFIYPNHPFYSNVSRYIASAITTSLMIQVMQLYCNQKPSNSRFFHLATILKWLLICEIPHTLIVFHFFPGFQPKTLHYSVFIFLQLTGILIVTIAVIEKIVQRYKPAIFYFVAVSMLIVTGVMATLQELGTIHYSTRTPNLLQVGFIVEIILISFGMLYRYNLIKSENNLLTKELNEHKFKSIRKMFEVQAKEQKRIAEDLHDLLGGQLAVIKMKMNGLSVPAEDKLNIVSLIDNLSSTTRGIAHNMLPAKLSEHALSNVIQFYVQELNKEQPIRFEFIQTGTIQQFDPDIEVALYKIILELIQNILKHSMASEATLQLFFKENSIELNVEDNGIGMPATNNKGMGMKNISSRLELFSGKLHIDSTPGYTIIIIKIPLDTKK